MGVQVQRGKVDVDRPPDACRGYLALDKNDKDMNWSKAIRLLEEGKADAVVTTAIVLRSGGSVWLSFDGKRWEKTESEMICNTI